MIYSVGMQRFTMMLPEKLIAQLEKAAAACGCGSKSAHIRHILTERLNEK